MNWISVRAVMPEAAADPSALHEIFARHGMEATVEHDDPPGMSAYVCEGPGVNGRIAALGEELLDFGAVEVTANVVPEEDWSEAWKQFFKVQEIGSKFIIKPSWEELGATDRMVIELDPGQAFGTGEHATTKLCLMMLEGAVEPGDVVLDVGCGSGTLSIGAAMLGGEVYATEVEAPSANVAAENAKRNGVGMHIVVADAIPEEFPPADVIVSNIISATLIRLAPSIAGRLKDDGVWIASGIIPANLPDVTSAAAALGLRVASQREEGGWVCVSFRR